MWLFILLFLLKMKISPINWLDLPHFCSMVAMARSILYTLPIMKFFLVNILLWIAF